MTSKSTIVPRLSGTGETVPFLKIVQTANPTKLGKVNLNEDSQPNMSSTVLETSRYDSFLNETIRP
jgi:hypothetical protein